MQEFTFDWRLGAAILALVFNAGAHWRSHRSMKKKVKEHDDILTDGKFVPAPLCTERMANVDEKLKDLNADSDWLTDKFFEVVLKGSGEPPPRRRHD